MRQVGASGNQRVKVLKFFFKYNQIIVQKCSKAFAADMMSLKIIDLEHKTDFLPSATLDGTVLYNQELIENARNLWTEAYPKEPFEFETLKPEILNTVEMKDQVSYDLLEAMNRQRFAGLLTILLYYHY